MSKLGLRFALEVLFLLAVAVAAALLELGWLQIVLLMGAAWLLTTVVEWSSSRTREQPVLRPRAEPPPRVPAFGEGIVAVGPARRVAAAEAAPAAAGPDATAEPLAAPEPAPVVPEPVLAPPEPAPVVPEPVLAPPEPAPVVPEPALAPPEPVVVAADEQPEPEPEPEPERVLEPEAEPAPPAAPAPVALVPPPAPEWEPEPEPEPVPAAVATAPTNVVTLTPAGPREWNLWELERLTREVSGDDPVTDEERAFLLVYLRDFASPDGLLPVDFDGLVRESFGDLLDRR